MNEEYTAPQEQAFEIKTPPPPRNGSRVGIPLMSEFVAFLQANEGVWAVFYTYKTKQSGYQRASDSQKKYGPEYEFVARHDENGTTVYGRYKPMF
jgi:hypothetical protein